MPGMSSPGTPGESSISANALRMAYSPFRSRTNRIRSLSCAAVQIYCGEYWKDPSPATMTTGRFLPLSRSARAMPTLAGVLQTSPPLERVRLRDRPGRVEISEIGGALLHEHRVGRADPAQLVEHLPRREQASRVARTGCLRQGGHPVR
jgi:hypothetical protein